MGNKLSDKVIHIIKMQLCSAQFQCNEITAVTGTNPTTAVISTLQSDNHIASSTVVSVNEKACVTSE